MLTNLEKSVTLFSFERCRSFLLLAFIKGFRRRQFKFAKWQCICRFSSSRLFTCMSFCMPVQITFVGKAFFTNVTWKGLFSCVSLFMTQQYSFCNEAFFTNVTWKGFSPVWVLVWINRWLMLTHLRSQISHLNSFFFSVLDTMLLCWRSVYNWELFTFHRMY